MALIPCRDCGIRISMDAHSCPHCGRNRMVRITQEEADRQEAVAASNRAWIEESNKRIAAKIEAERPAREAAQRRETVIYIGLAVVVMLVAYFSGCLEGRSLPGQ